MISHNFLLFLFFLYWSYVLKNVNVYLNMCTHVFCYSSLRIRVLSTLGQIQIQTAVSLLRSVRISDTGNREYCITQDKKINQRFIGFNVWKLRRRDIRIRGVPAYHWKELYYISWPEIPREIVFFIEWNENFYFIPLDNLYISQLTDRIITPILWAILRHSWNPRNQSNKITINNFLLLM